MKRKRVYLAGLDTEDDGNGNPFLWCVTHERGSWHGRSRAECLYYLRSLADRLRGEGRQLQVWATNLEYDLCNVFDADTIATVSWRFGRHALVGARWKGVDFRDTMRHVPIGVEAWGELVGLKKRGKSIFRAGRRAPTFAEYLKRCQRDASITFRAAQSLHAIYRRLGEHPRLTLASTALGLWRRKYFPARIARPEPDIWSAALEAYHGGRTQAFRVGAFRDVRAIDVASMFPWAMTAGPLPLPWGLSRRVPKGSPIEPLGLYHVSVRSDLRVPRLPVRTNEGTQFPNGAWDGWYVGEELLSFVAAGGTARVLDGYTFSETVDPFRGYVRAMYRRKARARGTARLIFKLFLNSLYGKFGQQGKQVRCCPVERIAAMRNPPDEWRLWNGLAIYTVDSLPPPWGNNLWPAFVTARARVRLADEIGRIEAAGGDVLYCDTDSVLYMGARRLRYPANARLGGFERRGDFREAVIVGKKEYGLKPPGRAPWQLHVKGVPAPERRRFLRSGVASFKRPVRMREAARSGETVNVWRVVRKERRRDLRKSAGADGRVATPIVGVVGRTAR